LSAIPHLVREKIFKYSSLLAPKIAPKIPAMVEGGGNEKVRGDEVV
jgi:hypothetical protein